MTQQAKNCIDLFRGNDPATIKRALKMQRQSIVNELKDHYKANDIDDLAYRLAIG